MDSTGSPQPKKAQFLLAESYYSAGRYGDSVFAFQRFLDNFPKSEDTALALFHLASAHYALKDFEPASQHYQRLVEEYPESEYSKAAQFNLALAYKSLGKLDRAQEAYSRYVNTVGLKDEGGKAALWEVFGLQRDRKDFTAAMATLERILNAGPDPDTALEANYRRGEILLLNSRTRRSRPGRPCAGAQGERLYHKGWSTSRLRPRRRHAKERAEGLRRIIAAKGGKGAKASDAPEESPSDAGKTQVMPEEAPAPKAKPPSEEKPKKKQSPEKSKKLNLPGVN